MLPQGIFSVAVATVLFPTLARFAARGELRRPAGDDGERDAPDRPPADPGGGGDPRPLRADDPARLRARRVRRRRRPSWSPTALFWFAFSLPFNGLFLLLTRTFFSLQRPWVPTAIAAGQPGAHGALLARSSTSPFGVGGIVAATAIATAASVVAQAWSCAAQLGRLELGRLAWTTARVDARLGGARRRPATASGACSTTRSAAASAARSSRSASRSPSAPPSTRSRSRCCGSPRPSQIWRLARAGRRCGPPRLDVPDCLAAGAADVRRWRLSRRPARRPWRRRRPCRREQRSGSLPPSSWSSSCSPNSVVLARVRRSGDRRRRRRRLVPAPAPPTRRGRPPSRRRSRRRRRRSTRRRPKSASIRRGPYRRRSRRRRRGR